MFGAPRVVHDVSVQFVNGPVRETVPLYPLKLLLAAVVRLVRLESLTDEAGLLMEAKAPKPMLDSFGHAKSKVRTPVYPANAYDGTHVIEADDSSPAAMDVSRGCVRGTPPTAAPGAPR